MNRFEKIFFIVLIVSFLTHLLCSFYNVIFLDNLTFKEMNKLKDVEKVKISNNNALIMTKNKDYNYIIGNSNLFNKYLNENEEKIDVEYSNFLSANFFINVLMLFSIYLTIKSLMSNYNKFSNDLYTKSECTVTLNDIAGIEETKEEVMEFIDILNGKNDYLKMKCKVPRGALFYGPPGTGKTLIAKAISNACNASFFNVSGSSFNEVFVGVGQSRVRKLFEMARANKPSIIFIDEIDTLGKKRSKLSEGYSEQENTLNSLLAEMDGMNDSENILIFGATNRPEILDDALMRPGRFDRKIQFNLPNKEERIHLLKLYLNKYEVNEDCLTEEYLSKLSDKTFTFSGADISNLCNEAAIRTVRSKKELIDSEEINKAFDYVIVGNERKSSKLTENEKKIVAYHEAGHALLSYIHKESESPIKISIIPTTKGALGYSMSGQQEKKLNSRSELLERMSILLGGRCSEELFMNDITTGASDDLDKLWKIAYSYVSDYGFSNNLKNINCNYELMSDKTKNEIDEEIKNLILKVEKHTKKMLTYHSDQIKSIASRLIEKEVLDDDDMKNVCGLHREASCSGKDIA